MAVHLELEIVELDAGRQGHDVFGVRRYFARDRRSGDVNRLLSRQAIGATGVGRFRLSHFNSLYGLAGETQMLLDRRVELVGCGSIVDAGQARIFDGHGNSPLNKLIAVKSRCRGKCNGFLTLNT